MQQSKPGPNAPDKAELRAIPLEELREFVRDRAEISSVRQVAQAAGMGRTTLHKFLHLQTDPHPRVRRLLALYYVRERDEAPAPEAHALALLVSTIEDEAERRETTLDLLDLLRRAFTRAGVEPPEWIARVRASQG